MNPRESMILKSLLQIHMNIKINIAMIINKNLLTRKSENTHKNNNKILVEIIRQELITGLHLIKEFNVISIKIYYIDNYQNVLNKISSGEIDNYQTSMKNTNKYSGGNKYSNDTYSRDTSGYSNTGGYSNNNNNVNRNNRKQPEQYENKYNQNRISQNKISYN